MTRDELIDKLKALAEEAQENEETLAAAGVLFSLVGAMYANDENILCEVAAFHSQMMIKNLIGIKYPIGNA